MFFIPSRPTDMGSDFAVEMRDGADRFQIFLRIMGSVDPHSVWNDLLACGVVVASGPTLVSE